MCFLEVPEESRLCMRVVFVIFGLAIVPNGGVHCPMPWLPHLQGRVNSHAGLLLRLKMDGYLQKLLGGRERIKHDYLALAKSALGPHECREEGVGALIGC